MGKVTEEEINIVSAMYEGDVKRDASSKIRGFIYQDYIAVMCLLKENVECVCSEYIEDVDVFKDDGTFEFIQVKYYPKANLNYKDYKEIFTDLYYQFLRLKILDSAMIPKPNLYIHGKPNLNKPTVDEMKSYIGLDDSIKTIKYDSKDVELKWLKENVYKNNKDDQKKILFSKKAAEDSIKEFIDCLNINHTDDINIYKNKLKNELKNRFLDTTAYANDEKWKSILLGVSISCIQERYLIADSDFKKIRILKSDYEKKIKNVLATKPITIITDYLRGKIIEEFGEIIYNNDLSDLDKLMLYEIYKKTLIWIADITKDDIGQVQLLNTISIADKEVIAAYTSLSVDDRLIKFAECSRDFTLFLDLFWKIILNLGREKITEEKEIKDNIDFLSPQKYYNETIKEYICLNFPDNEGVDRCIILPSGSDDLLRVLNKICIRMRATSARPEKWFFKNNEIVYGKNYYEYSTAEISEDPSVVNLGDKSFYIECMKCIKTQQNKWTEVEKCSECIFLLDCVGGKSVH